MNCGEYLSNLRINKPEKVSTGAMIAPESEPLATLYLNLHTSSILRAAVFDKIND
jgi:hypothetical protein